MFRLLACALLLVLSACATSPAPRSAPAAQPAALQPATAPKTDAAPAVAAEPVIAPEPPPTPAPVVVKPAPTPAPTPMPAPSAPAKAPAPAKPEAPKQEPMKPAEPVKPAAIRAPQPSAQPVEAATPTPVVAAPAAEAAVSTMITGRLRLTEGGKAVDAVEYAHAVVYFVPDSGSPGPRAARTIEVKTRDKRFDPDMLVVPVGSTLRFPNQDPILHNVFSVSASNPFDLGLYGEGDSKSVTLRNPGVVLVNCNVHHAMQANVLVMDTPFYTTAAADGSFQLNDVPSGTGTLYVWQSRSNVVAKKVSLPQDATVELQVELTKPRLLPHTNKLGKPYRPKREY